MVCYCFCVWLDLQFSFNSVDVDRYSTACIVDVDLFMVACIWCYGFVAVCADCACYMYLVNFAFLVVFGPV